MENVFEHILLGGMGSSGGKKLSLSTGDVKRKISIYSYKKKLSPKDVLTDGRNGGDPIALEQDSMLIWIDLYPDDAKFEHPTIYILLHSDNATVIKGGWYPVLNDKKILYEEKEPISIIYI